MDNKINAQWELRKKTHELVHDINVSVKPERIDTEKYVKRLQEILDDYNNKVN